MTAAYAILIFLSVFLSGSLVFAMPISKQNLKFILAFSGAYLLSICFMHILPDLYHSSVNHATIGLLILGGFMLQIILEFFSSGIEHGHVHNHEKNTLMVLTISLCVHSFLEGMPLSNTQAGFKNALLWGIIMHNIPVGIAYASMLRHAISKKSTIFFYLGIFAIAAPLGIFLGSFIQEDQKALYNVVALAITVGIFLHISTTIIFEASSDHKFNFKKLIAVLIGLAIGILFHSTHIH